MNKQDVQKSAGLNVASLLRIFFLWICWVVIVGITSFAFFDGLIKESENSGLLFFMCYGGIIPAIITELKYTNHQLSNYVVPRQKKEWNYLLFFIPLIIASMGLSWFSDLLLYYTVPGFLESRNLWIENNPIFNPKDGAWHVMLFFITVCLVAPISEEFIFRGIIFEKIRCRWTLLAGIMVSSLIFGLLHIDFFGAFSFGVVLCLLYLETGSLFAPIGIHFLNNLAAFLLAFIWPDGWKSGTDLSYLFDYLWLDTSFLLIGLTWLAWFICNRLYLFKK